MGILPGKVKKMNLLIFSAHYDHLGIGKPNDAMDSIFNGANDDASGTTAVIILANYFKKLKNNERTLVFAAFTAEESGGFGSQYFSKQLDPEKVMAMFNIEMIGTDSKWGTNSAFITGYEKTDMGKILEKNLEGSHSNSIPIHILTSNYFIVQIMQHWQGWEFLRIPSLLLKWIQRNSIIHRKMKSKRWI